MYATPIASASPQSTSWSLQNDWIFTVLAVTLSFMATFEIEIEEYVSLLVKASEFDPARWPEGLKEGATLLGRIRQIEQMGIEEHGRWDWEEISEELQDEYDSCCSRLNRLRDSLNPQPSRPLAEVIAELDKPRRVSPKYD